MKSVMIQKQVDNEWYDWGTFPYDTKEDIDKIIHTVFNLGKTDYVNDVRILESEGVEDGSY